MSSELSILALFGLLVMITIFVQVLLAIPQLGISYLASSRDGGTSLAGAAARSVRCVENSVVALVLFGVAVLVLHVVGGFSGATLLAAQIFLIARVVYIPVYLAGISYVRTGVWMVGFLATAFLMLSAM